MEKEDGGELELPGFRFHPTEEELLEFYLRRIVAGKRLPFDIIATVDLYRHDPCDLPGLAKMGEKEWYFFVPRDRKQASGGRPNRTTARGFWKATGSDRPIRSAADPRRLIGLKKTLVFYRGRAPRGTKTEWVMNEYRLPDATPPPKGDIVLCKIYRKAMSMKELEQQAAMETAKAALPSYQAVYGSILSFNDDDEAITELLQQERNESSLTTVQSTTASMREEQLPNNSLEDYCMEWMEDGFLSQLSSVSSTPWMDQWSPCSAAWNF